MQNRWANLREERFRREVQRFENMEANDVRQVEILETKKQLYNAGKKNHGGAAYNLLNLDYDKNNNGQRL